MVMNDEEDDEDSRVEKPGKDQVSFTEGIEVD